MDIKKYKCEIVIYVAILLIYIYNNNNDSIKIVTE